MSRHPFNLISIHEAIDILGISRSTFDRWRKQKQLPFTKIGKEILVDQMELEHWVRHHASDMQPPAFRLGSTTRTIQESRQPQVVTIGYQSRSAQMWTSLVMKELAWFEEELAKVVSKEAVQVRWFDADNGPTLVQGLISGHTQIASLGDYPIALSFSLSEVLPAFRPLLLAFDGKTSGGRGISLVIRNGIQIRHDSEISKLTLSTVAQSSSSHRLSKLLTSLGGHAQQIVHKEIDDSMAGIVNQQIQGSIMIEPYLSLIQYYGTGQVLFKEGIGEDFLTGIVADETWAGNHPDITIAYLKAHIRVHSLMRRDPLWVAQLLSRITRIPAEVAARIIANIRWDSALYTKDLKTLHSLNPENNLTKRGKFVSDGGIRYRSEYLNQAIKALKLPIFDEGLLDGEWTPEQLY